MNQLKTLDLKMGVQQASVLAEVMSRGQELTDLLMFEESTATVVDLWGDDCNAMNTVGSSSAWTETPIALVGIFQA